MDFLGILRDREKEKQKKEKQKKRAEDLKQCGKRFGRVEEGEDPNPLHRLIRDQL